jgi:histone H3/H4
MEIVMAEKEMLLIGSKTKEALKGSGLNVAGDALDALNEKVHQLVKDAQARCEANGRKTVRGSDF